MAITKLPSGNWQIKIRGSDGKWMTKTFSDSKSAKQAEAQLRNQILSGTFVSNVSNQITVNQYAEIWFREVWNRATLGWRNDQLRMFNTYVKPVIGERHLRAVTPAMISRALREAEDLGRSPQSCRHIFNLMRKMFGDAVDTFQFLTQNPALKKLKPGLPEKETRHLNIDDVRRLLQHVRGKPFELAVWLGVYVGMRVGEIQALLWSNVDLDNGLIHIRRTHARKDGKGVFREYPKGKKWHSVQIPAELLDRLREAKAKSTSEFVVTSPRRPFLNYDGYFRALRRYCQEIGIPVVATHGLRHSTAGVYMQHGATRDDLRNLFAHSSLTVTDRYVHDKGERVKEVAKVIRLFPESTDGVKKTEIVSQYLTEMGCSMNVPCSPQMTDDDEQQVV